MTEMEKIMKKTGETSSLYNAQRGGGDGGGAGRGGRGGGEDDERGGEGEGEGEVSSITALEGKHQDNPQLVSYVRHKLVPPSIKSYNLQRPKKEHFSQYGQTQFLINNIIFDMVRERERGEGCTPACDLTLRSVESNESVYV